MQTFSPTTTQSTGSQRSASTISGPMKLVGIVVRVGGLLFGYDQGVISGALHGIKAQFGLSSLLIEVVTSWVTLGALFGALAGGELADRLGRKKTILIAGAAFVFGALIQSLALGTALLVGGRFVIGLGVGIAAVAAPLYGAEMAPTEMRGRFVSFYQLAITMGIFLAYLVDGALANGDAWRLMLGVAAVPGVLLIGVMLAAPESPRWLVKMGRRDEALTIIRRVSPSLDHSRFLDSIEAALREEAHAASWSEVFTAAWRKPLLVAVGLAVFQQVTGINAIIYYADRIFAAAGFTTPASQTLATTWAIGGVNVLATFIAIAFIDRLGRRPLLLAGLVGMGVSLAIVGIAFHAIDAAPMASGLQVAGIVTLIALVAFIISFAFSLGPVVWTVINEIFPGRVRGRAVAVATAVNWGAAFLVSEFFLTLIDAIGPSFTFWLFGLLCGVCWVWVYCRVPETKDRSLEEIEEIWVHQDVVSHTRAPMGQPSTARRF